MLANVGLHICQCDIKSIFIQESLVFCPQTYHMSNNAHTVYNAKHYLLCINYYSSSYILMSLVSRALQLDDYPQNLLDRKT